MSIPTGPKQLAPRTKVLLQTLIFTPLVKKLPTFYGRWCPLPFTAARQQPLYWDELDQSTPSQPVTLRSVLISFSHLRLNRSSHLPSKRCMNFSSSHTWYRDLLDMVRQVIHITKEAKTLMLKLHFYTQLVVTPTCCDLSWSSSSCIGANILQINLNIFNNT
jgi:hypothetical protein